MLTLAGYGLLAIVIMAVLYVIAAKVLPAGEQIAPPVRDDAPWSLPATRELTAADIAEVRLPVALRGYRFAETDLLLDRLGEELRERDAEITRLRAELAGPAPSDVPHPHPDPLPPPGGNPYSERPYAAEDGRAESGPNSGIEPDAERDADDAERDGTGAEAGAEHDER